MKNLLYSILVLLLPEIAMTQNIAIGGGAYFTVSNGTDVVIPGNVGDSGTISNSGSMDVAGDWTNNGTANVGATGTVTFDGSSDENISGSTATYFGNFTIDNSSGVTLSSVNATIEGALTFSAGLITTGSNTLYLGSAGSVTGAGAGQYVYGNFNKNVTGVNSVNFEIGDASVYAPIDLGFGSSATGSVTASTTPGQDPNISTSKIKSTLDVARYWTLSNSTLSGFGHVNPTFNYAATDVIGGATPANFIAEEYTGGSWTRLGISGVPTDLSTSATGATAVAGAYAVGDSTSGLTVSTQPKNDTVCAGTNASFTSSAYAIPNNPTVQWQENRGSGWNNIVQGGIYGNPTDTTLVLTGVTSGMNGYQYQAVFTGTGSATSIAATLTVNPLATPTITPGGATAFCQGGSVTLDAGAGYQTYVWNPSGSIETITASTSGTYSVTVTNTNGCTGSTSQLVTVNNNPTVAPAGAPSSICIGQSTTLNANVTLGSGAILTYTWNPNDLGNVPSGTISPASTTTYDLTVTDVNSCSATGAGTITVNSSLSPTITGTPANFNTCGGSVSLNAGSGYSAYAWSPSGSTQNISASSSGSYSVTVTNSGGCTGSAEVNVTVNTGPSIAPSGSPSQICLGQSSTLNANATAGSGAISTYNWSVNSGLGNVSSGSVTPASTSTYTLTVTDANSCSATGTATVSVVSSLTPVITGVPSNFNSCSGSVSLNAGSGYSSYSWSPGGQSSQSITASSSGAYSVTVTNSGGCTGSGSVNVTVNTGPSVAPNATPSSINSGGSSTLAANATQGSGAISTYVWSSGCGGNSSGCSVSPNSTSTYNVTVTDANSCSASGSVTVTVIGVNVPTPTFTGTPSNFTSCGSVTVTASGGYSSYSWSNGATTQSITATSSGLYGLTVTQNGGSASASQLVTVYANPAVSPSATPNTICAGQHTELQCNAIQGSASISVYVWSSGLGSICNGYVSPGSTTTYNLTVTDANSCSATGSTTVTVNSAPSPLMSGTPSNFTGCGSVGLDAGAGYTYYLWSTGATTESITATSTEIYSVTVSNGSCTGNTEEVVYVYQTPFVDPSVSPNAICSGQGTFLSSNAIAGSAPIHNYLWSSGLGNIPQGTVYPITSTTYNLTVIDANFCTATGSASVTVNTAPSATITGSPSNFSACGSVGLDAGGGYSSYLWSTGATTESITASNTEIYSVTVSNGSCTGTAEEMVNVYASPSVSPSVTPNNICSGQTTVLECNATRGSAAITMYQWSAGLGNICGGVVSPSSTTTYSLTVTDGNSCSASGSTSITVSTSPSITITGTPSNFTGCGSVALDAGAGYASYLWSTGATTESIAAHTTEIYSVTASNGSCSGSSTQLVTVYANPTVNPLVSPGTACAGQSCLLYANAEIGSSPIQIYDWSSGLGNTPVGEVAPNATTTYDITVYDGNNCSATGSTTLTINSSPAPVITGTPSNFTNCGSVSLSAQSGFTFYLWNTGQTTQSINAVSSGIYSVTASNGTCIGSSSQAVTVNTPPTVDAGAIPATINNGGSSTVSANAIAGSGPITNYSWSSGLGDVASGSVSPNSTTTYDVTVSDINGCSATGAATVNVNAASPPTPTITGTPANFIGCGSVTLNAGAGYNSYSWSTGATTQTITVNSSNTYSVTVTNGNGSGNTSQAVTVYVGPTAALAATPAAICSGQSSTLNANATQGSGAITTYGWSGNSGLGNVSSGSVSPGSTTTYNLTVTDANSCSVTGSAVVTVSSSLLPTITGTPANFTGCGSVGLDAGAGYGSYSWSPSGSTETITANSSGIYSVTVSNGGCTGSASVNVNVTNSLSPSITGTPSNFSGCGSVGLNAGSGYSSYSWSPSGSTQNITASSSGTYSVTVSNGGGCTGSASVNVTVNSSPSVAPSSNSPVTSGNSIDLAANASGGGGTYIYVWSGPDGYSSLSGSPIISNATSLNQGNYFVTVQDNNGCTVSGSTAVTVTGGGGGGGFVWTGGTNTDFGNSNNWSGGQAPSSCSDNITIPNTANKPTISSNVQVGSVTVNSGVTITNNAMLSVCGTWTGGGSNVSVMGTGVVMLNGNSAQTVSGQTEFTELVSDNASGISLGAAASISILTALDLESGNFNASSGTLTFLSTSSTQCAIIDNFSNTYGNYSGTLSGSIKAERYYAPSSTNGQHYMGSPVNTPMLSQFGAGAESGFIIPGGNCSETQISGGSPYGPVLSLNQSNGASCGMAQWYVEPGTSPSVNGQGYSVNVGGGSGVLTVNGTANLNSTYELTGLSNSDWSNTTAQGHTLGSGWQLVSNPYLATMQISSVDAGIEDQIQIWNTDGPYAGSYQPELVGLDAVIPPFQGFMVIEENPSGGTLTLNAGDRTRTPENFFAQNDNQLDIVSENVNSGLLDKTTVAFNHHATDGFDSKFDANKFAGGLARHTIYSVLNNDKWMGINVLNSVSTTATVPVGFEPASTDNAAGYSFNFNGVNTFDPTTYIYLEDVKTGTMYDVRNGAYTFTANGNDNWSRFVLHFTPPAVISSTNASCSNAGTISISQPGTATWNYQLKDNNNAIISSGVLNQSNALSVSAQAGAYTLTLVDNNNYTVTKSIVVGGTQDVTAGFTVPSTTVAAQTEVSFSSTSANANNYSWNFGDGMTATGIANPTHVYSTSGTYAVTLTVTSASGCSASVSQRISVGSIAAGLSNLKSGNINMWSNADRIYVDFTQAGKVDATIRIFDILGQEITTDRFTSNTVYQRIIDQVDAAYVIVSVVNDDKVITRKLFIANVQY